MASSSEIVPSSSPHSHLTQNLPSKKRTLGFAIVIILSVGSFAMAGVGAGGFFYVGSISGLNQVHALIMMTVGSTNGILLLIIAIIVSVKNHQQGGNGTHSPSNQPDSTSQTTQVDESSKGFIEKTSKGRIRRDVFFGSAQWSTYFGDIGVAPPLASTIIEILNWPCPFSDDMSVKIKDTHMLVLIPATLNGEPVTLNKLMELMLNLRPELHKSHYDRYNSSAVKDQLGDKAVAKSHWVLMTRDVIPGTMHMDYEDVMERLEGLDYVLSQAVEAVTCILAEFVVSGVLLYGDRPYRATYCAETVERGTTEKRQCPVFVGGFHPAAGLRVYDDSYLVNGLKGFGALMRF